MALGPGRLVVKGLLLPRVRHETTKEAVLFCKKEPKNFYYYVRALRQRARQ
jgi:hypothetical protein